jgi:hypothetical protein
MARVVDISNSLHAALKFMGVGTLFLSPIFPRLRFVACSADVMHLLAFKLSLCSLLTSVLITCPVFRMCMHTSRRQTVLKCVCSKHEQVRQSPMFQ